MAVTQNWQYDLNGVTFGQGATLTSGSTIALTEITGFDLPELNVTTTNRSSAHGAYVTAKYLKERTVVLSGRVNSSAANYAADTFQLKAIFARQANPIPFTFRLTAGLGNMYLNVKPLGVRYAVRTIETAVGWVDFQATMVAEDPRIYSITNKTVTLTPGGATQVANNTGIMLAPTSIAFNGPLTNPVITNQTFPTETFGILGTVGSGATYTAKSLDATVFNGASNVYNTIDPANKTFLEVHPGNNTFALAGSGAGNVVITWQDAWL